MPCAELLAVVDRTIQPTRTTYGSDRLSTGTSLLTRIIRLSTPSAQPPTVDLDAAVWSARQY